MVADGWMVHTAVPLNSHDSHLVLCVSKHGLCRLPRVAMFDSKREVFPFWYLEVKIGMNCKYRMIANISMPTQDLLDNFCCAMGRKTTPVRHV
jgi:hypothetical protein